MVKSKIEWCDYSINVIKGYCPNTCSYCYSHRMYNRFKWDKTIRFDVDELKKLKSIKEPSKIFVGSMIDMYHDRIDFSWIRKIINYTDIYFPQHTFITLTKVPLNLSYFVFPRNWWMGITITQAYGPRDNYIKDLSFINIKFVSFEPLLESMEDVELKGFDWIIIGGLTPKNVHKTEWIDDIVNRADKLNIPVYIKENANYKERRKFFPNFKV